MSCATRTIKATIDMLKGELEGHKIFGNVNSERVEQIQREIKELEDVLDDLEFANASRWAMFKYDAIKLVTFIGEDDKKEILFFYNSPLDKSEIVCDNLIEAYRRNLKNGV